MIKPTDLIWPGESPAAAENQDHVYILKGFQELSEAVKKCSEHPTFPGHFAMCTKSSKEHGGYREDLAVFEVAHTSQRPLVAHEMASLMFVREAFRDGWTTVTIEIASPNARDLKTSRYMRVWLGRQVIKPGQRMITTPVARILHTVESQQFGQYAETEVLDAVKIYNDIVKGKSAIHDIEALSKLKTDPETLEKIQAMAKLGSSALRGSDRVDVGGGRSLGGSGINPRYRGDN